MDIQRPVPTAPKDPIKIDAIEWHLRSDMELFVKSM